jgi:hypothetical protein
MGQPETQAMGEVSGAPAMRHMRRVHAMCMKRENCTPDGVSLGGGASYSVASGLLRPMGSSAHPKLRTLRIKAAVTG